MTNQEMLNSLMNDPSVRELIANLDKNERANAAQNFNQNNLAQNSIGNNNWNKCNCCCDCCNWCWDPCCNCWRCNDRCECRRDGLFDGFGIIFIIILFFFCGCGFWF